MAALTMPVTRSTPTLSIGGYLRFLHRHRWLVALSIVLGIVVGTVLAIRQPIEFSAGSRVAVTPQESVTQEDLSGRPRLISLDSDAQLLQSTQVLAAAVSQVAAAGVVQPPAGGVSAVRSSLVISAVPNSRVLIVKYSDPSPQRAVAVCAAIVDAFLAARSQAAQERAVVARATIESQIGQLSDQLVALSANASDLGTTTFVEEQKLSDQLLTLRHELSALPSGALDPGIVISAARQRDAGQRPMAAATVVSGALLGLIGGLLLARGTDLAAALRARRRQYARATAVRR